MQDFPPIPSLVPQIFTTPSSSTHLQPPPPPQPLTCPRCDSTNTKFCYYNNYNLSQPRHFCKACRRYWTKGGVLRNVPVGGGCRKNSNKKTTKSKPAKPKPVSGSSSESSLTTLTANPEPVLELDTTTPHQVLFSDSGFGLSDPGLMVGDPEPEKVNGLDWGGSLFDMTVDPAGVYWNNNQTHWVDTDSTLFLP